MADHRIARRLAASTGGVMLLLTMADVADAGCAVGNFQFQPNDSKTVVMTVTRLTKCTMTFSPGGSVLFDALNVTSQPHHGRLSIDGTRGISFTPGNTYVGPDAFAFDIVSHQGTTKSTATISVAVTIE